MELLVIGGTRFVGRHLVDAALGGDHRVTLFHRGLTNPDLFPQAEHILGDRDGGLDALGDRTWDAVVDTCGYLPRVVRASARALAGRAGHYTFVSSLSVYAPYLVAGAGEEAALVEAAGPGVEEVTPDTYGGLKVLCEREVVEAFGDRALVVRPGLIIGPHDPTDRFPYWPRRIAAGGTVLAPGRPERPVQFIDARDLGRWMLHASGRLHGFFNAVGRPMPFGALLERCWDVVGGDAEFAWLDDEFLLEHDAQPWSEIPLWIPESEPGGALAMTASAGKAMGEGLAPRPVAETIGDTLSWDRTRPASERPQGSLEEKKERQLLDAWEERSQQA